MHIASGNYNPTTSCTYTDVGLFTASDEVGADATELFNYLTGCSRQTDYRQLLVAPVNLRVKMNALIDREIAHQRSAARDPRQAYRLADRQMKRQSTSVKAGVAASSHTRCLLCDPELLALRDTLPSERGGALSGNTQFRLVLAE